MNTTTRRHNDDDDDDEDDGDDDDDDDDDDDNDRHSLTSLYVRVTLRYRSVNIQFLEAELARSHPVNNNTRLQH
ncbi:hypothetical protein MAR_036158 [Mya arenaria]|uniref:Uncharacterized protein n=1 Tax=Mya arenaria TaxID=6604 RepID=A0ABY7EQ46_MYAAR|nr:hypothetical protein MAR_036158 [Mya arenaria]